MSIFLIRHGETALNAARVVQPADTPLSERGIAQADALAPRIAELGITAILSSDLPRALRTAQAIAAATGVAIQTTSLLHERNFGDLRGRAYDDLAVNPLTLEAAPSGGESIAEFERRVATAFDEIVKARDATDGNLAVVTHGLVIRALLSHHARLDGDAVVPEHMGNTSISILDARAPFVATLMNCTAHLDAAVRDDARALSGG